MALFLSFPSFPQAPRVPGIQHFHVVSLVLFSEALNEESYCDIVRIVISCLREDQGVTEQIAFGSDLESGFGTALA